MLSVRVSILAFGATFGGSFDSEGIFSGSWVSESIFIISLLPMSLLVAVSSASLTVNAGSGVNGLFSFFSSVELLVEIPAGVIVSSPGGFTIGISLGTKELMGDNDCLIGSLDEVSRRISVICSTLNSFCVIAVLYGHTASINSLEGGGITKLLIPLPDGWEY